ncbi:hypothetical protein [Ekhidna sp.]|uniref:hypothetical protein n=1 Tax=Ekhidna sp. TaxID=2608089 RepID=UPI0032EBF4EE
MRKLNYVNRVIVTIVLLLSFSTSSAQTDTILVRKNQLIVIADSLVIPKKDTTIILPAGSDYKVLDNKYVLSEGFYDSIYSAAKKTRVTKELYNLLITNRPTQQDPFKNKEPVKSESFFEDFEGRVISSIDYISVDLFGGSVNDTTLKAESSIGKLTNELHKNTKKNVVFKHLLFDRGDEVNAFEFADTERIIRSLPYIEDARIVLKIDPENLEGVKVYVIVKDRFPWSIDLSIDNNDAYRVGFTNQNILGSGNEFGIGYLHTREEMPMHGYDAHYTVRNIDDSFIDGTIFLSDNYLGKSKGITFKRDFLSPNIKYYGEATFEHVEPISDLIFADSLYEKDFNIDRKSYDVWGGRSFQIDERKTFNAALRLQHDNFDERPMVRPDSNELYHNHHFLIGALSYSKINFLKTKNILSFNITEDVPIGFIYSFIMGKDWTEFGERDYKGVQISYSTYKEKWGYFFLNLESGYFSSSNKRKNQVLQIDGRHFTPLFDFGGAYSRIFTRFHYFDGDNLSIPISQSLSGQNRIRNIEGMQIEGNKLMTLTSEYVVFQPWYFYGFRFATYGHLGVGNVRESRIQDPYNKTYFTAGGGVRIRNESLVFDTFEFRVSLFPNAPTEGQIFYFKVTLSAPQFFQNPNVRKPRIVGLD